MSVALKEPMTLAAFLDWEGRQEFRFEFDGFQPVAMVGVTVAHAAIQRNLLGLLFNRLRGHRCQAFGSALKILVAERIRYPDAFVVCSPVAPGASVVDDPVVVFEILSPGTSYVDRIEKNREYRATPSIQRYVILEQTRPAATVHARTGDGWLTDVLVGEADLALPEIGARVPLAELYEGVTFPPDEAEAVAVYPMSTPLAGLLVVSLEQAVAAPYCSSRLADAGARVIKIERQEGDFARGYDKAAKGLSSYFVWLNRGKQSLVADIKQPADAALLHRILSGADVFIQNLAPGAAARAGFGADELRAQHPRLITVDISGYGDTGDYATMKAYDLLVQAESGLAMITGHPAGPGRVGVSACDIACGMAAHAGVLEALIERGVTGRGKGLKVSLFDGMADWMNVPLLFFEGTGRAPERLGLAHPSICPYGAFATDDGALVLISIQNEREWLEFCATFMGEPELPRRDGFQSNVIRVANRPVVDAHIAAAFARMTRAQAAERLRAANTAYGFVNDVAAFAHHPALRRATVETPNGPVSLAAPPVLSSDGPRPLGPVPAIGEHSAAIRAEFAA